MMPTKMTPSTSKFLVAGVVGFAIFAFSTRQSLIGRSEEVSHRWANVESTLQRRLDLIPQLTEAVQSATAYESETLLKITEERNELLRLVEAMKSAIDSGEKSKAEQLDGELVASVRAFTGLAREAYPELKANEAYLTLMTQLEGHRESNQCRPAGFQCCRCREQYVGPTLELDALLRRLRLRRALSVSRPRRSPPA